MSLVLGGLLVADVHGRAVFRAAAWTFCSKAVAAGAAFLLNVLLARHLGVEGYGLFSYVFSLTLMLTILSCFGLSQAATRFVAGYVIQEEWSLARGFVRWSRLLVLALSTGIGAGLAASTVLLSSAPTNERQALLIGSATVVIGSMMMVQAGILRGLKRVASAELAESGGLRSLVAIPFFGAFLAYGGHLHSASQGMAVMLLSTAFSLIAITVVLGRVFPPQMRGCDGTYEVHGWLTTALPMFVIAAAVLAQSQISILMLRHLAPIEEVGAFAAAARLAMLVGFGLGTVNAALAPVVAEMYAVRRHKELQRIIYQMSLLTSAAALLVLLAGITGGSYALELFGPGFERGYLALVILLSSEGFNALAGSTGCLMAMTGLQRAASVIMVCSLIANIALNALLIPGYGMAGAAVSTLASTILWNVVMMLYLHVKADIRSTFILMYFQHIMKLRAP